MHTVGTSAPDDAGDEDDFARPMVPAPAKKRKRTGSALPTLTPATEPPRRSTRVKQKVSYAIGPLPADGDDDDDEDFGSPTAQVPDKKRKASARPSSTPRSAPDNTSRPVKKQRVARKAVAGPSTAPDEDFAPADK